jgi:hypothetical protein
MGRVDEHFVGHWRISWRQAGSRAPVETGAAHAACLICGGTMWAGPGSTARKTRAAIEPRYNL